MGDRYFLTVICPHCGHEDDDVYYAPTCGFLTWRCPGCRRRVDLAKYTGISREQASNRALIEVLARAHEGLLDG